MSKEKREFTGVFIPAHIWVSKELIPAEKMLLGEIEALSKRTGWCEASREHFAEWLQCAVQNITYYFNKLEKSGFLEVVRTPGKRSKSRVVSAKFYTNEEVNPIYPTRKPHLPPPVNPIYPTRKPHLPEIQLKDKSKNKSVPRAENSPTLKTETPHVENESSAAEPQIPPPSPESVAYATDPAALETLLRTYYQARPADWKSIKERLDRAAAQVGKKYSPEKIKDVVGRYCDWTITKGHTGWTFSQHHARLRTWMADQPSREQPQYTATTTTAPAVGVRKDMPVYGN